MTRALLVAALMLSGCATTTTPCGDRVEHLRMQPPRVDTTLGADGAPARCVVEVKSTGVNWAGVIGAIVAIAIGAAAQ